ncbi:hypothetical protein BaRGS_00013935 [Batillaria attramentaria]|uniref:Uncharacterized protein n=1 Tax=Batillaria attramentaria TaxID=370345 RepID=A0ABD0L6A0_9CAEN
MPTSSQSRILTRIENQSVHPFLRQCSVNDATVMSIPRVGLPGGVDVTAFSPSKAFRIPSTVDGSPSTVMVTELHNKNVKLCDEPPIPHCSPYGVRTCHHSHAKDSVPVTDSNTKPYGWAPRTVTIPSLPNLSLSSLGQTNMHHHHQRHYSYPVSRSSLPTLLAQQSCHDSSRRLSDCRLPPFVPHGGVHDTQSAKRHFRHPDHAPTTVQARYARQATIPEPSREDNPDGEEHLSLLIGLVQDTGSPTTSLDIDQQHEDSGFQPQHGASSSETKPQVVSIKKLYRQLVSLGFNSSSFRGLTLDNFSEDEDVCEERKIKSMKVKKERRRSSSVSSGPSTTEKDTVADYSHTSKEALSSTPAVSMGNKGSVPDVGSPSVLAKADSIVSGPMEQSGSSSQASDAHAKLRKAKLPTMRLRSRLPPPEPDLMCFRCCQLGLTHWQVKQALEDQTGDKVLHLHFDPEYLHIDDAEALPRVLWMFQMADSSSHSLLISRGLFTPDGERVRVRPRDDVYQEEHRAWNLVQQIKDEHHRRSIVRRSSRSRRSKEARRPSRTSASAAVTTA